MNHRSIVQHESDRVYKQRGWTTRHLDWEHFAELNKGAHVIELQGYCIDAVDEIPGGCMVQFVRRPAQYHVTRGVSLAEHREREALAQRLVDEILAEERKP